MKARMIRENTRMTQRYREKNELRHVKERREGNTKEGEPSGRRGERPEFRVLLH
jgi:hypothetical protein